MITGGLLLSFYWKFVSDTDQRFLDINQMGKLSKYSFYCCPHFFVSLKEGILYVDFVTILCFFILKMICFSLMNFR